MQRGRVAQQTTSHCLLDTANLFIPCSGGEVTCAAATAVLFSVSSELEYGKITVLLFSIVTSGANDNLISVGTC